MDDGGYDCGDLLNDLQAYVNGEAAPSLCAQIEHHLANCENCHAVVDTLRQTAKLYRSAPQPSFPAAARERLYKALDLGPFLKPKTP